LIEIQEAGVDPRKAPTCVIVFEEAGTPNSLRLDPASRALEPETPQGSGKGRVRLRIAALELREAGEQELRVRERDERALEARSPEEAHRCRVEPPGILAGDQDEQRGGLVEVDAWKARSRRTGCDEVTAGESTA
jgi:hypothetical protein